MQHAVKIKVLAIEPPRFRIIANHRFQMLELVARNPLFELSFDQLGKVTVMVKSRVHLTAPVERRRLMHSNNVFRIRPID